MHFIQAKSILSPHNGMNLYRGCQHGCIYCDSRSLCYGMDHDFEDIAVKENGLLLLEQALRHRRRPCMIGTGAMTDPYMPLERQLRMTRGAMELAGRNGFGFTFQTKSDLFLEDLELLTRLHRQSRAVVQMTLTTCDEDLCRILEPGAPGTRRRYLALKALQRAGIPTVVWLCPVLPFLTDTPENIRGILSLCADAGVVGVIQFGMGLTLRQGNREYFYAALDRHFPGLKERYIRSYGNAYSLSSPREPELLRLFHRECERLGLVHDNGALFRFLNAFPPKDDGQMGLW